MESLMIGEGPLSLHEMSTAIEKSSSFHVQKKWKFLAHYMDINESEIPNLERKVGLETLHLQEVPRVILKLWKADKGSKATFKVLCDALTECGVQDIAEALNKIFGQPEPTSQKFLLQRKVYTLEQLVGESGSEFYQSFTKKLKMCSSDKPISLLKEEFSLREQPEYYISRTFLSRTQLDERIFKADSAKEHIFVFIGASRSDVAQANGYQMIESSGNQLDKISVRFIILECEDDFEKICKNTPKSVHKFQYINKQFYWVQSTQSLDVIREHLNEMGETFDEEEVISRITAPQQSLSALSIADSPGMGKTLVLTNLAAKIGEIHPNPVTVFIVLHEFVKQMHLLSRDSALDSILSFISGNYTKKLILQAMLKRNAFLFFIFLDGYDEVLQDKLHLVDSFLQDLVQVKNIRVIVTTRPHLKSRLEDILNLLTIKIMPFNHSNQIEFLIRYWITKHGATECENLHAFATKCLSTLEWKMTDTERSIAAIPLQCMMLAEVFSEDATRVSEQNQLSPDAVKEFSFFQMYKFLVDLKFSKVSDLLARGKYLDAHVYDSIVLLFPEWLDKFKPYLTPRDDIDENTLYSIGLLEKTSSSNLPRFLHRTFAEYVLADFIAMSLEKSGIFVEFLCQEILGGVGVNMEQRAYQPILYKLKHPVISYFINMYLQEGFRCNDKYLTFDLENITAKDVCSATIACCCNDLERCFNLTMGILQRFNIREEVELKDKYFKDLLHLVVENTNNASFVQKVLNFSKQELEASLSDHVYKGKYSFGNSLEIQNCTPLHVAVEQGKYNIVMYLLQEYGHDVLSIKDLLHVCVDGSANNKESVIEEKLSIIEALTQQNKDWLYEIPCFSMPFNIQKTPPLLTKS